jgi:hypothetical protein
MMTSSIFSKEEQGLAFLFEQTCPVLGSNGHTKAGRFGLGGRGECLPLMCRDLQLQVFV